MARKTDKTIEQMLSKGDLFLGNDSSLVLKWRPTGIGGLDDVMGGGLPVDRFVLVVGHESAAKTLLCQMMAASVQAGGGRVALVDSEVSYDPRWWVSTGVNVDELLVSQPPSGEAAVDVATALIGQVELLVIDSMAALVPLTVQERSAEQDNIAPVARMHAKFFYGVMSKLRGSGTTVVGINQQRDVIGGRPGQVSYPGGRAQRFYAHLRLDMHRAGWMTGNGGKRIGVKFVVSCGKNKTGRPGASTELPINFDGQFDYVAVVVSAACDKDDDGNSVIDSRGAYWRFPAVIPVDDPDAFSVKRVEETGDWQVMGRDALNRLFTEQPAALTALELLVYGEAT